jgi:primosomal protein N' (replication factor Y) (superfamily II helicase)
MQYVEIYVADSSYHGNEALTYSHERPLSVGQLVYVPLRNKQVLGVVVRAAKQPTFKTKAVTESINLAPVPRQLLALLEWMRVYYPAPLGILVQQFLPKSLPKRAIKPFKAYAEATLELPPLTQEQTAALASMQSEGLHVLHGETGTGKTRIYLELARTLFAAGKSSIILTPEIGLTSQLAANFKALFGDRVIILHSQLSESVRHKLWATILQETEPLIIIGPRSALFSPVASLGLIILDESHESAYKQDQSPYYHTTYVAATLAHLNRAPLLLGSATPSVTDYFIALQKKRPIIRMAQAARTSDYQTTLTVVDLREKTNFTRKSFLSNQLITATKQALSKGEQTLLFLNRRGTARVVLCENCGWQAVCPHCDVALVYHADLHSLRCHSCDFAAKPPHACPECHEPEVVFRSIGTKAVTEEVQRLFPDAVVQRFDTDNKKDERIEHHYETVKNGEVDIIVGTQTLAKGLDLPKLSTVGVILADSSLFVPDFSSQERTYQLLHQVIGRVGRGHRDSTVILQTYNPDSPLLKAVIAKNWQAFYETELQERQKFLFPPYCFLLKLRCRRATQQGAEKAAVALAEQLKTSGLPILVEGPAPSFHEKSQQGYEWQLIIKAKQRPALLKVIAALPANWHHDIDPMNLL